MKFCDLNCEYARFPDTLCDGSNTCRTFIGLYCEKLERIVSKNGPCQVEMESEEEKNSRENSTNK